MRLAGTEKMGYYPTPEPIAIQIGLLLDRTGPGLIRALDPCCGEGTALQRAIEPLGEPVETYGVELDRERATTAGSRLTKVIHADIRDLRATPQAFGLLWLNPPYDWDAATDDDAPAERLERVFLHATMRYLQPGGTIVFLIPQHRLDPAIAKALAYRFDRIQAFRFPDPYYTAYRQLVIFGIKKRDPSREDDIAAQLQAIGHELLTPAPLPERLRTPYPVPETHPQSPVIFRSAAIDPQDLLDEIERHGAGRLLLTRLTPHNGPGSLRPLMPLRKGHLALVLASGHLNNQIVEDPGTGQRRLVKGTVKKDTHTTETQEDGMTVITERDVLTVTITALDLDNGTIETIT